jgi:hypothetical protein
MAKFDFNLLDEAAESAPMTNSNKDAEQKIKAKLVHFPEKWETKIRNHIGKISLNSYITLAIYERMKKDGII